MLARDGLVGAATLPPSHLWVSGVSSAAGQNNGRSDQKRNRIVHRGARRERRGRKC